MLVLTRKLQEQIRIGQNVTITVLRVKGRSVRLGIEAPRHVRVVRGELPPKAGDGVHRGATERPKSKLALLTHELTKAARDEKRFPRLDKVGKPQRAWRGLRPQPKVG